ncbi:hypothetical protein GW17_00058192 [Ensete ventricosum]|nr:hypothetical protein GW17_00058192 [Ensete ventricosum]
MSCTERTGTWNTKIPSCIERTSTWNTKIPNCTEHIGPLSDWVTARTGRYVPIRPLTKVNRPLLGDTANWDGFHPVIAVRQ